MENSAGIKFEKFSANFFVWSLENVCHSEHFVENEENWNDLVKYLVNMVDGIKETGQNPTLHCQVLNFRGMTS